jgi:hypothetical protein
MAEVNYVNPASFQPQTAFRPSGPLAGALMNQQINDYNQIMGVQHQLQGMGLEEQAMKLGEFKQAAPMRAMERDTKMAQMSAERPFIEQLASSGAQNQISKNNFQRETQFSPEAKTNFFEELKNKAGEEKWKKIQRELEVGFRLAVEAKQLAERNGATAAMGHVQKRIQEYKEAGINLPEDRFMDPNSWDAFIRAGIESQKFMQESELQGKKDTASKERNDADNAASMAREHVRGKYGIAEASIRASAKSSNDDKPGKLSETQEIPTLRDRIARHKQGSSRAVQRGCRTCLG